MIMMQAHSMSEARELYDQLAPLCPIMLALTGKNRKMNKKITNTKEYKYKNKNKTNKYK